MIKNQIVYISGFITNIHYNTVLENSIKKTSFFDLSRKQVNQSFYYKEVKVKVFIIFLNISVFYLSQIYIFSKA